MLYLKKILLSNANGLSKPVAQRCKRLLSTLPGVESGCGIQTPPAVYQDRLPAFGLWTTDVEKASYRDREVLEEIKKKIS